MVGALARAHDLTLVKPDGGQGATLHTLIRTLLTPYQGAEDRLSISGPDTDLGPEAVTAMALLVHEFATNAAKYGALSTPTGRILIECSDGADQFGLVWREVGGPHLDAQEGPEGFGSRLARGTASAQLDGAFERELRPEGLVIRLTASKARLHAPSPSAS